MTDEFDVFDDDYFRKITNSMIDAITSPEFVAAMRAVRAAPEEQRLVEGSRRLSPAALRAQGVRLPADMRISSRYFETGYPVAIEMGDYPEDRTNLVNALNDVAPGFLDQLLTKDPELFRELVTAGRGGGGGLTNGIGICVCGGTLTFCACAGTI